MNLLINLIFVISYLVQVEAQCNSWITVPNQASPSGNYQGGSRTLAECQTVCQAYSGCQYGFDYVEATRQCWISTTSTLSYSYNVQHWACSSSNPVSTPSTCQPTYTIAYNKHFTGGIQNSETTLDGCQRSCTNQASCIGIDYSYASSPNACWILTQTTALTDQAGVNHYDKSTQGCGSVVSPSSCQPTYTVTTNKHFTGGTQNSETTLDGCQRSCTSQSNCIGIDYNYLSSPNACWILTQTTALTDQAGVNHYDKSTQGCSNSAFPLYTLSKDMKVTGGGKTATTALEACKIECVNTATCVGFDFNRAAAPNECWLLSTAGNLISSPGVDHYDLTRSAVRPLFAAANGSSCSAFANASAIGFDVQSNVNSVDECTNFCVQSPMCTFGAIWNSLAAPGQQCGYAMKYYLHVASGFTYFECLTNGVLEVANVTSEFLGNPTGALTSTECGLGCSTNANGAVWSHQERKCFPVVPNARTSLFGSTFFSCKD